MRERDRELLHSCVARAQKAGEFVQHASQRKQQRLGALHLELEIEVRGVTSREPKDRPRICGGADQAVEKIAELQLRNA